MSIRHGYDPHRVLLALTALFSLYFVVVVHALDAMLLDDTRRHLVITHLLEQSRRKRKQGIGVDSFLSVKSASSYRNP